MRNAVFALLLILFPVSAGAVTFREEHFSINPPEEWHITGDVSSTLWLWKTDTGGIFEIYMAPTHKKGLLQYVKTVDQLTNVVCKGKKGKWVVGRKWTRVGGKRALQRTEISCNIENSTFWITYVIDAGNVFILTYGETEKPLSEETQSELLAQFRFVK